MALSPLGLVIYRKRRLRYPLIIERVWVQHTSMLAFHARLWSVTLCFKERAVLSCRDEGSASTLITQAS